MLTMPVIARRGVPSQTTASKPMGSNTRWIVCGLLFAATTINYMDRSAFSLIEPLLHGVRFMGWNPAADSHHQPVFDSNFGNVIIWFQIAYGVGLLMAGRVIDKVGTRMGYAVAIGIWATASFSHGLVGSVLGFCLARIMLGLGESGNFPAAIKSVTEWFPAQERGKAIGLFNSGSNVSAFIAPALVAWVTAKYGWRAAFFTTSSMGFVWLGIWLAFPYYRLRQTSGHAEQATDSSAARVAVPLSVLLRIRGFYAFCLAKGLTDPVWWFYLFYLPEFLNRNYGLDLKHAYWEIVCVYAVSSVGSIFGGSLSGWQMKRGHSVNAGRKLALLVCALAVVPVVLVPHAGALFPANPWPATFLIALAAAAHQGWSANLFSTSSDMFPSRAVATVVGIGGATGAAGGAAFTWIVKHNFSLHPLLIFVIAGSAYLVALAIFQLLVPRLGMAEQHTQSQA